MGFHSNRIIKAVVIYRNALLFVPLQVYSFMRILTQDGTGEINVRLE